MAVACFGYLGVAETFSYSLQLLHSSCVFAVCILSLSVNIINRLFIGHVYISLLGNNCANI